MNGIQRAIVIGLLQNGIDKCFRTAPVDDTVPGTLLRGHRYLDLLASQERSFGIAECYKHMGWVTGKKSNRVSLNQTEFEADRILEKCGAYIPNKSGSARALKIRDDENSQGYCFEGLRFRFWKLPHPKPGDLDRVAFEWVDESACGATCGVAQAGRCRSKNRLFDPVLPEAVKNYRDRQDAVRKSRGWPDLTVIKVLEMEPQGRGEKLVIRCCKEAFSNFDCTNYPLPYLLADDGTIVLDKNKKRIDPRDLSKSDLKDLKKANPNAAKTFREHLGIPPGFDLFPQNWILGTNLGISICIIQVDESGNPLGTLLSWRAAQDTSLKVGFNELHVGASSQIKLEYHLREAPNSLDKNVKLVIPADQLPFSEILLKKAIDKECCWEAGILPEEITSYHFLGAGWMLDLLHPELLLAITTRKDIIGNVPNTDDLAHGEEFRAGGKGKLAISMKGDYWKELARHLLGYPLGVSRDAPVQWSPQGATALIEAHRCGQFWKDGEKQLSLAIQEVIDSELIGLLPPEFAFTKNETH